MYYYGYGVTQDTESGIFWMNKAAAAHYGPAIRALAAIEESNIKEAEKRKHPNASATPRINAVHAENTPMNNQSIDRDVILDALNNNPPTPSSGHVTVMPMPDQTASTQLGSALKKISENTDNTTASPAAPQAKKYTLQLLGSYYLSSLKARQAELNLGTPTHIGHTKFNGRDWYVLTIGQYPALGNAELAKLDLPKKIKDFNPWIRKCDELTWVG